MLRWRSDGDDDESRRRRETPWSVCVYVRVSDPSTDLREVVRGVFFSPWRFDANVELFIIIIIIIVP